MKNVGMKTKLILPIILLCTIGFFGGSNIIEKTLNDQIYNHQKEEIHQYANRIYYTLRADYKTLFFQLIRKVIFILVVVLMRLLDISMAI